MNPIIFKSNEPQLLSLRECSGVLDGFHVLYECSDGRILQLPRPAAINLNELEPAPGEEFSAIKRQTGKEPAEWVFALTPRSEQARAAKEAEAAAAELARRTKEDLPRQLQASVLRQMPKSAGKLTTAPPESPLGDGTYGPIPQAAPGGRKTQIDRIPFNLAFREVVSFVTKELNASGEQWSEQSRQDLVATVLIAGSKAGWIAPWERGEAGR